MHLIVDQVVQLEVVHVADGDGVVELVAGAAVVQLGLAVGAQAGLLQRALNLLEGRAVKVRRGHAPAQRLGGHAQVHLQYLAQVHTARNAQRIQNDLQRGAVRQERHVLLAQYAGDDALVAVAAGHLVAHGDLALLGDVHAHHAVDARGELRVVLAVKDLHVHDDALLAVRHLQGGIAHLARLLAEDRAQQALLRGQLGLALRGDLAHQDVARVHLGAHADDAVGIEVLERVVADVGQVAGDLLRAQLGVAGLALVLLQMDGGEDVVLDQLLGEQDRVLVVVAFPGHEADQDVAAQGDLAVVGGRAVGDDVALLHLLARGDDRTLVDAGRRVGAGELGQLVGMALVQLVLDDNGVSGDLLDEAVLAREHADAGVLAGLVLDAGGDERRLRAQQRHGLALHVGTHQRTVRVVVIQERDHRRGDGDHLARGHVDVVDAAGLDALDVGADARGDAVVDEVAVLVERLLRLGDVAAVLLVGGEVHDLVGDARTVAAAVDDAVRRLDEAVLVDARIGRQGADQADVRTFRRLNRADACVVGVVHVADLEGGAVAVQAARAQRGEAALVRQLSQRVVVVHELGQLGGTEELLDRRGNRADVDELLRLDLRLILHAHALAHDALQAGQADADLVLQQLAHRAQAAVAQVVDIVGGADAVGQAQQIADGGDDVVNQDVLGHQRGAVLGDQADLRLIVHALLLGQLQQLLERGQVHHLVDAGQLDGLLVKPRLRVHEVVADDADHTVLQAQVDVVDAGVLNLLGQRIGLRGRDALAGGDEDLAGARIDDVLIDHMAAQARGDGQLLVVLVAAHAHHVVALGIKERGAQQLVRGIHGADLARSQAAVDLHQAGLDALDLRTGAGAACAVVAAVASHGRVELLVVAQQVVDLLVRAVAQGAQKAGDRQLARAVHADPDDVVGVDLVLQPGAAAWDDLRVEQVLAGLVDALAVVHARGAHELADDDALAAVDDERAVLGHQREVAHEDLALLDLAGLVVGQADQHLQRGGVGHVAFAALLKRVLGRLVQRIIDELQLQVAIEIVNRRNVIENLAEVLLQKTLVGILLNLDQIGHLHNFFDAGKALANPALSKLHVMNPDVLHDLSFLARVADGNHECHHP